MASLSQPAGTSRLSRAAVTGSAAVNIGGSGVNSAPEPGPAPDETETAETAADAGGGEADAYDAFMASINSL